MTIEILITSVTFTGTGNVTLGSYQHSNSTMNNNNCLTKKYLLILSLDLSKRV